MNWDLFSKRLGETFRHADTNSSQEPPPHSYHSLFIFLLLTLEVIRFFTWILQRGVQLPGTSPLISQELKTWSQPFKNIFNFIKYFWLDFGGVYFVQDSFYFKKVWERAQGPLKKLFMFCRGLLAPNRKLLTAGP